MSKLNNRGFGFLEFFIALFVIGILSSVGWYIWKSNGLGLEKQSNITTNKTVLTKTSDLTKQDSEVILTSLDDYCHEFYRTGEWSSENISANSISLIKVDKAPFIAGDYARMTIKCDSSQVSAAQKPAATTVYLINNSGQWNFYDSESGTPKCSKFDGQKWPVSVVGQCVDNGTFRTPKN